MYLVLSLKEMAGQLIEPEKNGHCATGHDTGHDTSGQLRSVS